MFARIHKRYALELRADLQQFYGLNIDGLGKDFRISHAVDLTVMLPANARIRTAAEPATVWGWNEYLLADISYSLRWLVWSKTKDGSKNRNHPKRILPPGSKEPEDSGSTSSIIRNLSEVALTREEYLGQLAMRRQD